MANHFELVVQINNPADTDNDGTVLEDWIQADREKAGFYNTDLEFKVKTISFISPLNSKALAEKNYRELNQIKVSLPDLRMMLVALLKDGFNDIPLADLLTMIHNLTRNEHDA